MTGVELAARLREVAPETMLVLHSARIAPATVEPRSPPASAASWSRAAPTASSAPSPR